MPPIGILCRASWALGNMSDGMAELVVGAVIAGLIGLLAVGAQQKLQNRNGSMSG